MTGRDVYPCSVCHNHCNTGIECNTCHMWIHYLCSALPNYLLITLIKTNRKYTCLACTSQTYLNYDALSAEMEDLKKVEEHSIQSKDQIQDTTTTAYKKCSQAQTGHQESQDGEASLLLGSTPEDMDLILNLTPAQVQTQREERVTHSNCSTTNSQLPSASSGDMQHQQGNGGESETPQQQAQIISAQSSTAKTREIERPVCKYYVRGTCKHGVSGKNCYYQHPKPCHKLLTHGPVGQHGCTRGRNCKFFHPKLCRNSIRHQECLVGNCKFPHIKGTKRRRNENLESPDRSRTIAAPVAEGVQQRVQCILTETGSQHRIQSSPSQAEAQHPSGPSHVIPPHKNLDVNTSFLEIMSGMSTLMERLTKVLETQQHGSVNTRPNWEPHPALQRNPHYYPSMIHWNQS